MEEETADLSNRLDDAETAIEGLRAPFPEGSDPDVVTDLEELAIAIEELQVEQESDCDALGVSCFFLPPVILSTPGP